MKKRYGSIAILLAASLILAACSSSSEAAQTESGEESTLISSEYTQSSSAATAQSATSIDVENVFSNRDLSGEYDADECETITLSDSGVSASGSGVTTDGSTVTITAEGTYIIEGSLSDGMIIVDADKSEKVQLVLNGVSITSASSAPIYVKQADKVFITLADGTVNTLTNGGEFVAIDDNNIDAVIFSKDDLTLNGTGKLTITSPAGHGIVSKDELVITNGAYTITAASQGLSGKEIVAIANGSFNITAGKDAIHSFDDDDSTVGCVYIEDGSFNLAAESDGISAMNEICISGGSLTVTESYEGIEACVINISGGTIDITSSDDGLNATDKRTDSQSGSGGFGGGNDTQEDACVNISGGVISINAQGDGIDSNGYISVSGGELYIAGSTNSSDGALDYGLLAEVSGGIVVAAGQSGMAMNFGSSSMQGSILVNTQTQQSAGTTIALMDSDGTQLLSLTAKKSYNSVVISCPEIEDGGTYTVKTGDDETQVTMDGLIYGNGSGMGGMGGGGFGGGGRGGMRGQNAPDDSGEKPDGEAPNGENPGGEAPNGERPDGEAPNGEKPDGEAPNGQMPGGGGPGGGRGGMMQKGAEGES